MQAPQTTFRPPPKRALNRNQVIGLGVLLVIACALPFLLGNYQIFQLTMAMAYTSTRVS